MEANGEVTKIDNRMQLVFCILLGLLKKNFFNLEDHRIGFSFFKVFCLLNLPATLRLSIHATAHQGFVRLFVRSSFVSSVRSFVRSFVLCFIHSFVLCFIHSFVSSFAYCSFVHLLVGSLVRSFVRSFAVFFRPFVLVRSLAC